MFDWIKVKLQRAASAGVAKDVDFFTDSLLGMPVQERALILFFAQLNRAGMVADGMLSALPFRGHHGEPMSRALTTLDKIRKEYVKVNSPQSAGVLLLQLSLLCICHINLRYKGQEMWILFEGCGIWEFHEAEAAHDTLHPTCVIKIEYDDFKYVPEPLRWHSS